jgi:hypothetical protein
MPDAEAGAGADAMRIDILPPEAPRWQQAADLIARHFAQSFGATVRVAPVELALATGEDGSLLGAAGIRTLAQGFASQIYLDLPVAEILTEAGYGPVASDKIIEVVSLACPRPRATLPLIDAIIAEGRRRGMTWGLFTATGPLVRLLKRTDVPVLQLGAARRERIAAPENWGSYYDTAPCVCAVPDVAGQIHFMPHRPHHPPAAEVRPCI